MINLKNVKKEKNKIFAEYYPEDSTKFSKIEYDVDSGVFKGEKVGHEMECNSHLAHAKFTLREMANGKREIKDCKIMWY